MKQRWATFRPFQTCSAEFCTGTLPWDFDAWMGSHLQILFSGQNDPQMCCEMRRVTLNRTHDSIMAAALRAIQILSVWLILCNNQPIMARSSLPPSDSEKEKDDNNGNNDEEEVEDNHPIMPRSSLPLIRLKQLHLCCNCTQSEQLHEESPQFNMKWLQHTSTSREGVNHCWSNLFAFANQLGLRCNTLKRQSWV